MRVGVVIPTHNRKNALEKILEQLERQQLDEGVQILTIVVVDGSTDGTLEMLQDRFPDVHIVIGNGHWWYTKSINMGLRYLEDFSVKYVLIMNDDCEIEEKYVDTLIKASEKVGESAIIGSLVLTSHEPYRIFFSGVESVDWRFYRSKRYRRFLSLCEIEKLSGLHSSVVLPGRGMFIPSKILSVLNYFDEVFPQYGSDDDFCLRALKQGIGVYVSWDARVYSNPEETGAGSYFVKQPFLVFLRSFVDRHSRTYLKKEVVRLWRHGNRLFFPVAFAVMIRKHFTGYVFGPKVDKTEDTPSRTVNSDESRVSELPVG